MTYVPAKLLDRKCPECGGDAIGSLDWCPGRADMILNPDGTWEWDGRTEMFWDGQINEIELQASWNVRPKDDAVKLMLVNCGDHEWEARYIPAHHTENEPKMPDQQAKPAKPA